ncbi:hypothetical protein GF312_10705 [Candidatus Poribacteria bacterium]|nr:hypothetical protein [Candidatus Poribacteria bacterium]
MMKYILTFIMLFSVFSLAFGNVEFIGEDKDTKGNWPELYGKNGAIVFAPLDIEDLKDINVFDDGGNQRWDWANPTQDERGLIYPDDPDQRAGSCMFNNPVGVVTIETDLKNYQVAVYVVDWDSSVRVQDMVGFQEDPPDDPDVTVENPDFHEGIYYIWEVTGGGPFSLQITHKGGANWVISGLFLDALNIAVETKGKLATTWAGIKL